MLYVYALYIFIYSHIVFCFQDKRFDEDLIVSGQHAFLMLLERIESLPQTHQVQFY